MSLEGYQKLTISGTRAIIAMGSARGGVGKSVLTVNLAAQLALLGKKVGILDANLESPSVAAYLGLNTSPMPPVSGIVEPLAGPLGLEIGIPQAVASDRAEQLLVEPFTWLSEAELNGDLRARDVQSDTKEVATFAQCVKFNCRDLVLVDLAPGTRAIQRIIEGIEVTGLVVVTQSSPSGLLAAESLIDVAKRLGVPVLGVVDNMNSYYCGSCRSVRSLVPHGDLTGFSHRNRVPILARLPFDTRIAESAETGSIFVRQFSDSPTAKQILALAHKLASVLEGQGEQPLVKEDADLSS